VSDVLPWTGLKVGEIQNLSLCQLAEAAGREHALAGGVVAPDQRARQHRPLCPSSFNGSADQLPRNLPTARRRPYSQQVDFPARRTIGG
jgi:hypothetical protein